MNAAQSTRYIGVTFDPQVQGWQASIWTGEELRSLGFFDTAEDAAMAYDAEARKLHGPHTETNFPREMWREPRSRQREKASQFIGVYRQGSKWRAALHIGRGRKNRRWLWIGSFDDEVEAARAYDQAARQHRGSQTELNFPAQTL